MRDDAERSVRKGVELVYGRARRRAREVGLERIDADGKPFDPNVHEAVHAGGRRRRAVVADTMRTGYRLKGRVLRPAMVKVTRVDRTGSMAPQREWFEKDYYAVLGVSQGATEKEHHARAYRKLAKQYHPDANPGNTEAEERFKEISAAYDVLGDPEKRKEYDEVREMVASGAGPAAGGFGGRRCRRVRVASRRSTSTTAAVSATSSAACSAAGGGARRPRWPGAAAAGPRRGADLETELHLDFLDAVHGVTTSVNFTADAACSVCHGTGAEPGTAPRRVPRLRRLRRDRASTRARSRSRRSAPRAVGAARSSRTRARTAVAGASRSAPAR